MLYLVFFGYDPSAETSNSSSANNRRQLTLASATGAGSDSLAQANPELQSQGGVRQEGVGQEEEEEGEEEQPEGEQEISELEFRLAQDFGLAACELGESETSGELKLANNSDEEIITTVSYDLAGFEFLNLLNESGTEASPYTPLCVADLRELSGDFTTNPLLYIHLGELSEEENPLRIPIPGRGIACGINNKRNYGIDTGITISDIAEMFGGQQFPSRTEEENANNNGQDNEENPESGDKEDQGSGILSGLFQRVSRIFRSEPEAEETAGSSSGPEHYSIPRDELCTNLEYPITTLIEQDNFSSGEIVVSAEDARQLELEQIEQAVIPGALQALAELYKEENIQVGQLANFRNPDGSYDKIIHKNNAGIEFEYEIRQYELNEEQIEQAEVFSPLQTLTEEQAEELERTAIARQSVYFPWMGQLREMQKRLSTILISNKFGVDDYTRSNWYQIFQSVRRNLLSEEPDLDAINGSTSADIPPAEPLETLKNLLELEYTLFECSELEELQRAFEAEDGEYANNREAKDLAEIIARTDCRGTSLDEDPLQDYLCTQAALPDLYCRVPDEEREDNLDAVLPEFAELPVCTEKETDTADETFSSTEDTESQKFVPPTRSNWTTQGINSSHPAVDIGIPVGTELFAIADGRCLFAGEVDNASANRLSMWNSPTIFECRGETRRVSPGGFGRGVMLEHTLEDGRRIYSVYAHMSSIPERLREGCSDDASAVTVRQGEQIGLSGDEGWSCGAHLHFEIRLNKNPASSTYSGRQRGCDASYCDPSCLFNGDNCPFANPTRNSSSSNNSNIEVSTACIPAEQPNTQINPNGAIDNYYTLNDVNTIVNNCNPNSPSVDEEQRKNIDQNIIDIYNLALTTAERDGLEGSYTVSDLYPASKQGIYGVIEIAADFFGMPPAALAAHVHVENFGANAPNADLERPDSYNGNVDQIIHPKPNRCGAIGPGQFTPIAMGNRFPGNSTSRRYLDILECANSLGFNYQPGDNLNPSYVGVGICAAAQKLSSDGGAGPWTAEKGRRAASRYFGSCEQANYRRACEQVVPGGSLYNRYDGIF